MMPKTTGFVMSATTRPIVEVRPVSNALAAGLNWKPSSSAAARIRSVVFAVMRPGRFSARETVEGLTPASAATS
nr:hypothetical protein [Arenivirga flava]